MNSFTTVTSTAKPVRITTTVNGHACVIEAIAVGHGRWRAQLVRRGMTNAIMPFYGTTPDDAAAHLAVWLTRAGKGVDSK